MESLDDLYLNVGCYDKKFPKPYINIDIREECNPDVIDNAFELNTIKNNSVKVLVNSHLLEHLNYEDAKKALKRWYEVLKPEGILRISVPDFDAIVKRYIYTGNLKEVLHLVSGSQKHSYDFHLCVYNFDYLNSLLKEVGFSLIKRYNWWETDHSYCDDFSQAYLPANQRDIKLSHNRLLKGDGLLMSLNVEAVKC